MLQTTLGPALLRRALAGMQDEQRAGVVRSIQRSAGNRAVLRLLQRAAVEDPEEDFELCFHGSAGQVGIGALFLEDWAGLKPDDQQAVLFWMRETDQLYGARIGDMRRRVSEEERKRGDAVAGAGRRGLGLGKGSASGHTPDMAGGAAFDAPQIGLPGRINSSIGGQWRRYQPGFVFAGLSLYDADTGEWLYLSGAHHDEPARPAAQRPKRGTEPGVIARQPVDTHAADHKQEVLRRRKLNYSRAEVQNKRYAKPTSPASPGSLGWEGKLDGVPQGAALAPLWKAGKFKEFADAVAALQFDLGVPEKSLDGILGPGTWSRIGGLGEAMAGIDEVVLAQSSELCYKASEERIKRGTKLATGDRFQLPKGATASAFETIIAVHESRMLDVEERFRGAGAAGALVYSGRGAFVPAAQIWAGGLHPGAAIQVWRLQASYDLLVKGEIVEKGKKRRLKPDDADFYGTSFVFVRYDTKDPERILVRHFGDLQWMSKADWAVWVAANAGAAAPTATPP